MLFGINPGEHRSEKRARVAAALCIRIYSEELQIPVVRRSYAAVQCAKAIAERFHSGATGNPEPERGEEWDGTEHVARRHGVRSRGKPHCQSLQPG